MIDWLMLIIAAAVFVQPNRNRMLASTALALSAIGHDSLFRDASGIMYYGTAALSSYVLIKFTAAYVEQSQLVRDIHTFSFCSIALNAYGWALWVTYQSPFSYNVAFCILYLFIISRLIKKGGQDDMGGSTNRVGHPDLYRANSASVFSRNNLQSRT